MKQLLAKYQFLALLKDQFLKKMLLKKSKNPSVFFPQN